MIASPDMRACAASQLVRWIATLNPASSLSAPRVRPASAGPREPSIRVLEQAPSEQPRREERPYTAAAIALGIGYLIGRLSRRENY
jgi:hypothetical protein